jgi:hypothetical protein
MYLLQIILQQLLLPLLVGGGNDPWTNSNFISGDLTINGLVGDGFSKALNTGIIPSTCYPNANSAGLTIYNSTASNGTEVDMGCLTLIRTDFS